MQKLKKFRFLIVIFAVSCFISCSHTKHQKTGGASTEGDGLAQTTGLEDTDGFADDATMAMNKLKAPFNQRYYFAFDKYEVLTEDIASINAQADYLVHHPAAKIRLEGHTDERGSREYNITLGWKRAKAVAEILKQRGVVNAQLAVVSYGKEKPIILGHDELAYSKNRRVDLVYEVR